MTTFLISAVLCCVAAVALGGLLHWLLRRLLPLIVCLVVGLVMWSVGRPAVRRAVEASSSEADRGLLPGKTGSSATASSSAMATAKAATIGVEEAAGRAREIYSVVSDFISERLEAEGRKGDGSADAGEP